MTDEKRRAQARQDFLRDPTEEKLWDALVAYEQYPFTTCRGLDYTYAIKRNRHGGLSRELVISRREKTITKSTVDMAFKKALELGNGKLPAAVSGPKKLGTFGASYLYPVFMEIGIIKNEPLKFC